MRWNRRAWMMLAAASGLMSVLVGAFAAHGIADATAQALLKTGASYQLMHALATIACAVFMQAGARRARLAPAFFLGARCCSAVRSTPWRWGRRAGSAR